MSRVLTLAGRTGTGRVGTALAALVILFAALWMGAAIGETAIPFKTVAQTVANRLWNAGYPLAPIDEGIIWSYRLSRAVVAASCGASLALSGAVLQSLLRNPLADPYILGISAGASTGAVSVAILGVGAGLLTLPLGAFIGALVAFALVSLLAVKAGRGTAAIILAGVAGSQLFNALTSFIVTKAATAEQARGIMFWLLGNLSGVRWPDAWLAVPATLLGLVVCLWHARPLDAFTFGSESAASLGISVRRTYFALVGVSAMMTAVMVSIVGSIGFVGLVIPMRPACSSAPPRCPASGSGAHRRRVHDPRGHPVARSHSRAGPADRRDHGARRRPGLRVDTRTKEGPRMTLSARGVSWAAGGVEILKDVSLTVETGEFLGIIGPNGSGKTSLMSLISGIRKPKRGEVLLDGCPIGTLGAARSRKGSLWSSSRPRPASGSPRAKRSSSAARPISGRFRPGRRRTMRSSGLRSQMWTWRILPIASGTRSPAASGKGCTLLGRWRSNRRSCSSTSRPTISTSAIRSACSTSFAART